MKKMIFILSLVLLLTSCSKDYMVVYDRAIYSDYLASVKMGTPDERKEQENIGERLIVCWQIPGDVFYEARGWEIVQKVRFGNREEKEIRHPLNSSKGRLRYDLLDEDYYAKKGISTYKFVLSNVDGIVETWKHQIWVDYIKIE